MTIPRRKILPIAIGIALAVLLVSSFLPQPVAVDLGTVSRGPLTVTVDEDGKTRVKERYIVSAPLSGQMKRIVLEAGDPVIAGETLLTVIEPTDPALLDPRSRAELQARVQSAGAAEKRAAAELEAARARAEFAREEFRRAEKLTATGVLSRRETEESQQQLRVSEEALEAAQFTLQTARYEREQAEAAFVRMGPGKEADPNWVLHVVAPIDGSVLRVIKESGTVVSPATELIELGDPRKLEIEVDVLSSDAVRIRPGAPVFLDGWGGDYPLNARVRMVEPSAFTKISALGVEEQRVWVIADFTDPIERRPTLGDNYRVDARIVVWSAEDVLKVPSGALFRSGDSWAVFLDKGGRAILSAITIAHNNGIEAEVVEGLQKGDRVVLHPGDKIENGSPIEARSDGAREM